jgi:CheY-like chemotaxis protein/signal transduction histidine kinase
MDRVEFDYWKPRDVARLLSLVENERRYFQEMMALLPVGVALVAPALDLTMTNRAFRRLMGIERENTAERRLDDLLSMPTLGEHVREVISTRAPRSILSHDFETAQGKRTMLLWLQPFRQWDDEGIPEILVTLEDVTDMVPGLLPAPPVAPPPPALPAAPAPMAALLANAVLWRVNAVGMRFEAVEIPASLHDANLPGDAWRMGADFWSGRVVSAHLPLVRSFYEQVLAGVPLQSVEYRATTIGAGRTVWLRDVIRAIQDQSGAVTQIEGATTEVTHLRQREDSMAQALKIDALTRLAGRVAHECNNLLTILGGHGEELLHSLSPDNPLRANAQEILTAGDRLNSFTQQLSTFIKHPSPETAVITIDNFVSDYREELRQLLPSSIRLIVNTGAPLATASADPALLAHTLRTLVVRGAEAMRGEGALAIETTGVLAADPTAANRSTLAAGRYVQIAIRDSGHAIHPDLLQQLFEPPSGDEPPRHNLAAIYKSIREMGGDVFVTSEFDRGTSFMILLPRGADAVPAPVGAEPVEPETPAPPPPPITPRAETILVVEDEAGIRGLIRRILSRQNYEVIEASNGRQALEIAKEHGGTIDMLLTDVVMPEMGGFDLAQELLKRRPHTKVLFISGYTGLAGFDPSQLPPGSGFLQKPFTLNALLAKVREVFAQKAAGL